MQNLLPYMLNHSAVINPKTGDINSYLLWIVIAALGISAVVLIVLLISSRGKNNKKRR